MEIEHYLICTDQQLVAESTGGDAIAFEHLFNRYRNSIYQLYSQKLTGYGEDVEDLLQDTFIKVYLNLHKYDPEYTFGQWVYTIARNTFVDYIRRRRDDLSIDILQQGNPQIAPSAQAPNPEESFISTQQQAMLTKHLEKMNSRYRKLIELRFIKEYSYEEITSELRLPMGTVKTRIHRAREQLYRIIEQSKDL